MTEEQHIKRIHEIFYLTNRAEDLLHNIVCENKTEQTDYLKQYQKCKKTILHKNKFSLKFALILLNFVSIILFSKLCVVKS
jgi:hypothetical protein